MCDKPNCNHKHSEEEVIKTKLPKSQVNKIKNIKYSTIVPTMEKLADKIPEIPKKRRGKIKRSKKDYEDIFLKDTNIGIKGEIINSNTPTLFYCKNKGCTAEWLVSPNAIIQRIKRNIDKMMCCDECKDRIVTEEMMNRTHKICQGPCGEDKSIEDFYNNKNSKDGKAGWCKLCSNGKGKEWYEKNKKRVAKNNRKRRKKDPNYMKRWRKKNKKHLQEYDKEYSKNNRPAINKRARDRRKKDKNHRTMSQLRGAFRYHVKRKDKKSSAFKLLGCSLDCFYRWIEKQFLPGMTWENHGKGPGKWNYDHIIPCDYFKNVLKIIRTLEGQQMCFHYTNIQPMWELDNKIKNDTLPEDFSRRKWNDHKKGWSILPKKKK
jgi:hypothetical protein